jgi:hypothetical protein
MSWSIMLLGLYFWIIKSKSAIDALIFTSESLYNDDFIKINNIRSTNFRDLVSILVID